MLSKVACSRAIREGTAKYTPEKLFASGAIKEILEAMIQATCRLYKRTPLLKIFYDPESDETAATDGYRLWVNTASPLVRDLETDWEKYVAIVGHVIHELGHVFFTHFKTFAKMKKCWDGRYFHLFTKTLICRGVESKQQKFPVPEGSDNLLRAYNYFMGNVMNILEDGYIENRLRAIFSGVAIMGLELGNKGKIKAIPSAKDFFEKAIVFGTPFPVLFLQKVLVEYVCKQHFEEGDLTEDEKAKYQRVLDAFDLIRPEAEALQWESHSRTRCQLFNNIYVKLFDFFKTFYEEETAEEGQQGEGQQDDSQQDQGSQGEGTSGGGQGSQGESQGSQGEDSNQKSDNSGKNRESQNGSDGKEEAEGTSEGASGNESQEASGNYPQDLTEGQAKELMEAIEKLLEDAGVSKEGSGDEDGIESEATDEEKQLSEKHQEEGSKMGENAGKTAFKKAIEQAVKSAVYQEAARQQRRDLQEEAIEIAKKSVRPGVSGRYQNYFIFRQEAGDKGLYEEIHKEVARTARNLERKISVILKNREAEDLDSGYFFGQRFEPRTLPNRDGKYFSRQALPTGKPSVAFGVLIDESGSMGGEKIARARKIAVLMEDVLRNLNTPLLICGHSTNSGIAINSYVDFDTVDGNDKYRLVNVDAKSCNVDGGAITYMGEKLLKRPEGRKVLIVISDGYPTGGSFYDSEPVRDTMKAVAKYRKEGITVLGAIVDEYDTVARIYGEDNAFDCRSYDELEKQFVKVVKKNILYK